MRKRSAAADSAAAHADELFRSRLENQIDLRHPLAKLASRMPWADLEEALAPTLPPDPERGHPGDLPQAARDWPNLNFITYHACIQPAFFMAGISTPPTLAVSAAADPERLANIIETITLM
jgi:hypothetical protein